MNAPRHPRVETALTLDDVNPGVAYVTYVPQKGVVERGTFTTEATYDENDDRWNARAKVQKGAHEIIERTVRMYDAGIYPDTDNESWAEAVTIADAE